MGEAEAIVIEQADYAVAADAAAVVGLLQDYALHPMGNGAPLPEANLETLITRLMQMPGAFSLIAWRQGQPVGLANCLTSFSTFRGALRINIHDLFVRDRWQGAGVGRALLEGVRQEALRRQACAVTLEVRHDNAPACRLYSRFGFEGIGQPTVPLRADGKPVHFFAVLPLA